MPWVIHERSSQTREWTDSEIATFTPYLNGRFQILGVPCCHNPDGCDSGKTEAIDLQMTRRFSPTARESQRQHLTYVGLLPSGHFRIKIEAHKSKLPTASVIIAFQFKNLDYAT